MAAKDWMPKVIMVLNVIVGVIVAASAVLMVVYWLDSRLGHLEYLFIAISLFVLGLVLIFVEIGFKRA